MIKKKKKKKVTAYSVVTEWANLGIRCSYKEAKSCKKLKEAEHKQRTRTIRPNKSTQKIIFVRVYCSLKRRYENREYENEKKKINGKWR